MRVVIIIIMVGSHHGKDSILFFTILYRSINMYILNYTILLCYSGEVDNASCENGFVCSDVDVCVCVCVCVRACVRACMHVSWWYPHTY